jgi:putative FmdB family regulatory protein
MPTYEYICEKRHIYTEERSIAEDQKQIECPKCKTPLKRIYNSPTIIFNGTGFNKSRG